MNDGTEERLCPLTGEPCWQDDKGPDGKGCMFWKESLTTNKFGGLVKVKMCVLATQPMVMMASQSPPQSFLAR